MAAGRESVESDKKLIAVGEGKKDVVNEFPYLGSVIATSRWVDADINNRIAKASRTFGSLRKAVFLYKNLTLSTKRKIY